MLGTKDDKMYCMACPCRDDRRRIWPGMLMVAMALLLLAGCTLPSSVVGPSRSPTPVPATSRAVTQTPAVSPSVTAPATVPETELPGACGKARWGIKTGTDPQAGQIDLAHPAATTVEELAALPPPAYLPAGSRVAPTEMNVYRVGAVLVRYKLEADSDIHLVLRGITGRTMIVEIPSPSCVGSRSPFLAGITRARNQFRAAYPPATGTWQ